MVCAGSPSRTAPTSVLPYAIEHMFEFLLAGESKVNPRISPTACRSWPGRDRPARRFDPGVRGRAGEPAFQQREGVDEFGGLVDPVPPGVRELAQDARLHQPSETLVGCLLGSVDEPRRRGEGENRGCRKR